MARYGRSRLTGLRFGGVAAALLLASPAQAMTVAEFVRRADAVLARGLLAMASPEIPILRAEMRQAIDSLRARENAARARGRHPPFCLPPRGTQVDPFAILAQLRALPARQQRRLQVREALPPIAARQFPCR
jgi:hypothetical protein